MDHPVAPSGERIRTDADVRRLGLDKCIASYILPENMLWWQLDSSETHYLECLVLEYHETPNGILTFYRHWTSTSSTLYDQDGQLIKSTSHSFGKVPIIRLFDRKKPRCKNIGQSRYEGIAERQREYYNRDSELILSDTTQAHPLLQGPEDFVQSDGTIPIGPSWLLPKKKNTAGGSTSYEGFEVVNFPKDSAESIRKNKADLRDDVDRDSALVRHSNRDAVAQSGLSKALDHVDGNNRLAKIAKILARAERTIASLALMVLTRVDSSTTSDDTVEVTYPTEFDLFTATDLAQASGQFQTILAAAGSLPTTESLILSRLLRLCLPGLSDAQYAVCDEEIKSRLLTQMGSSVKN
jgi:hypothetical protein